MKTLSKEIFWKFNWFKLLAQMRKTGIWYAVTKVNMASLSNHDFFLVLSFRTGCFYHLKKCFEAKCWYLKCLSKRLKYAWKTFAHAPNFSLLVQNRMLLLSEKNKIEAKCWISKTLIKKTKVCIPSSSIMYRTK